MYIFIVAANYYRDTDALNAFKKVDAAVQTALLDKAISIHPQMAVEKIKHKYWYEEYDGRHSYALPDDKSVKVMHLTDTLLIIPKVESLGSKAHINPFTQRLYNDNHVRDREIQNVTGKYKAIWTRQQGKCHYCGRPILADQSRTVVPYDLKKAPSKYNLAYVHEICAANEFKEIQTDNDDAFIRKYNVLDRLENIMSSDNSSFNMNWKYRALQDFFEQSTKASITLNFSDIEKILEFMLPKSSNSKRFWYRSEKFVSISYAWESEGYKIRRLSIDKKRITFYRVEDDFGKLDIPAVLLNRKIPANAIWELENHFAYIIKKYGLNQNLIDFSGEM